MRTMRLVTTAVSALAVAVTISLAAPAAAQNVPADLSTLPPPDTSYTPPKTAWGDYDFSHTYQIEYINNARILLQRPESFGNRFFLTPEEFAKRLAAAERSDASYSAASDRGIGTSGTEGLADWIKSSTFAHRTSMLVDPVDGQLPPMTPWAKDMMEKGRSSWVPVQDFDWVSDFDSWDRCVSRGFPASMFPFRYNNGIRVFQSPGYVTIVLEMLGTRVIPLYKDKATAEAAGWPGNVESWMGDSRAWWEGKVMVIETTNIKSGDSVAGDGYSRAASPLNVATQATLPFNTTPMTKQARTIERLSMPNDHAIDYTLTYTDPAVFTAPWTARIEWVRDDKYEFFEYACHEGNQQIKDYISASRAHRKAVIEGTQEAVTLENDPSARFATIFDRDPAATYPNAPGGFGGPPPPPPPPKDDNKGG
ncbi:hypothetical protein GRI89_07095 [Altererythrobacter salegens]|uniref:DUF1329 domain-containing protein n=1 Tax=Croceibacterium salegens TaxID=1737568 RepID=A0A6I4STS7_9SPHN|nr:hypothetical protein [Croceibacterium salegens]MXO59305.1 hypothetical protein [Croceibacterium salegens]